MQPQTPQAPPPYVPQPSGNGQYDFIFNDQRAKRPPLPGDSSKRSRIIIAAAGGVILLLLIVGVASLLLGSGNEGTKRLVDVTKRQQELIRVSDIGLKKARGSSAQNLAATTSLSLKSDQAALLAAAGRKKPSAKELGQSANPRTDQQLTAAEQANRFDEAFTQTIAAQLDAYETSLKQAVSATSSKKTKQLLLTQIKHAQTLRPR